MKKVLSRQSVIILFLLLSNFLLSQNSNFTHIIRLKSEFVAGTSLIDGKISIFYPEEKVYLVGECNSGQNFNIIKKDLENSDCFAMTRERNFDKNVVLEILKDENDKGKVTNKEINLYKDTLNIDFEDQIKFVIPKGKKIYLVEKYKNFYKILVIKDNYKYSGFIKKSNFDENQLSIYKSRNINLVDNSIVRKDIYEDSIIGKYLMEIDYNNGNTCVKYFNIKLNDNLLMLEYVKSTIYDKNLKIVENESYVLANPVLSSIIIYDKEKKIIAFDDYSFKLDGKVYDNQFGWKYKVNKIQ